MNLRHKIFAHSDSESYTLTTVQIPNGSKFDVLLGGWPLITAREAVLLERMITKLIEAIERKMGEIRPNTSFARMPF